MDGRGRKNAQRMPYRREARQERAKARKAFYDALSMEDRLERLKDRRGESKREHARLIEQIRTI